MTQKKKFEINGAHAIEGDDGSAIFFPKEVKKIDQVEGMPYYIVQDSKRRYGLLEFKGDHFEEILQMKYILIFHAQTSTIWNRYLFVTKKDSTSCHLYDAKSGRELLGHKSFQSIFLDDAADGYIVVKTLLPEDSYRVADLYSGEYLTEPQVFIRNDINDEPGHLSVYNEFRKIGTFNTKTRELTRIG